MSMIHCMQRYSDGDLDAFPELYAATAPRLLGYLRFLLRDDSTAEEILQQTFMKLHSVRETYARGADPVPWLYSIAHRTCIDEMRRRRRSHVVLMRTTDDPLPEAKASFSGDSMDSESASADGEAELTALLEALALLPEDQRTAVALTKLEGFTMGAAARKVGTTEGAMKLRAHRAYARLRELLGCNDAFDDRLATTARRRRSRERARLSAQL